VEESREGGPVIAIGSERAVPVPDEVAAELTCLRSRVTELERFERIVERLPFGATLLEVGAAAGGDVQVSYANARSSAETNFDVRTLATLTGSETILLVEDEEQVRTIARIILRRNGYNVLEAQDGGEAFLLCEQYPARIDRLLTDMVMPHLRGPQLAERLLVIRPSLKVLYMSGYTDKRSCTTESSTGGISFLQKPITRDTMLRKVRTVLDA
jgi:CheY-like chemotaxis protein